MSSAMAGLGLGGGGGGGGSGGRKLLVFVIGGVTRSEMRAVHELSRRTGREIVLGSTTVLKPTGFLSQLRSIGRPPA
jgi:syntaxin-binding protein 1